MSGARSRRPEQYRRPFDSHAVHDGVIHLAALCARNDEEREHSQGRMVHRVCGLGQRLRQRSTETQQKAVHRRRHAVGLRRGNSQYDFIGCGGSAGIGYGREQEPDRRTTRRLLYGKLSAQGLLKRCQTPGCVPRYCSQPRARSGGAGRSTWCFLRLRPGECGHGQHGPGRQ